MRGERKTAGPSTASNCSRCEQLLSARDDRHGMEEFATGRRGSESRMTTAMTHTDKVVEKRRALGRGLDSLLPGPRSSGVGECGRGARTTQMRPRHTGRFWPKCRRRLRGATAVVEIPLELIDENPYQTRYFATEHLLRVIRLRLRWMNWRTRFGSTA